MEGGSLLINMLGWGGLFTEYPGYDRNSHGGCQSRETRRWLTGKPSGGAKLPATLESTEWLRLAEWHRSACFSATGKCQLPGEKRQNHQQKGDSGLTVTQWKIQGVVTSRPQGWGKMKEVWWREGGKLTRKTNLLRVFFMRVHHLTI